MTGVIEQTTKHLAVVLGPVRARQVFDECLREAGLSEVREAAHLHQLGTVLIKRGGFLEVVGRFLRVQAICTECGPRERGHDR